MVSPPPCACVHASACRRGPQRWDGSLLRNMLICCEQLHTIPALAQICVTLRRDGLGILLQDQHCDMIQVCLLLSGTAFAFLPGDRIGSSMLFRPNAKHAKARNPSRFLHSSFLLLPVV
jgi:hypothetical protein